MADEIAELVVRISADTADFASAVSGVQSQLSALDATRVGRNMGNAAQMAARDWQATGKALKNVGEGIDSVTKPIQVVSLALAAGGTAAAKFAIDFEDNFAAVKKTVDGTPEQLAEIRQGIIDLTTTGINGNSAIPMTTAELTELAAAGGQLGIQTENIVEFTETMAQLGTATNLVGEEGAQTLARFMNVTGTSQGDIDRLGSAIVDLGNNYATTEAEIAQMALRLGATASVVGFSTQDILAYSTALSSMGVEAEAGGSAVSRIIMDIQSAVSSGGQSLQSFAKTSGKTAEEFAEQWKTDASGAFEEFIKGLSQSEDIIGTLADLGFNNIRDIQALQRFASASGIELLTSALERANTAWQENTALQTEFDAKADTTASKIQIVKNNLVEAGRSLGEVMLPTIADATSGLANFAQGLAKMDEGSKKTAVGVAATVVGVGALSKVTAGSLKAVGNFVEGIGKVRTAFSAGGVFAKAAPLMTTLGHTILPVAAALGAAAIAIEVIDKNFNFPKGMDKYAEGVKNAADNLVKYNNLAAEVQELKLVINNSDSSAEQIETARARLKEIADMLGVDYTLDIECDTTELDEAIEKQQILSRTELIGNASDQINTFKDSINDYIQWTDEIERQTENASYWDTVRKIISDTRAEADLLRTEFDAGLLDDLDADLTGEEVYYNRLTELYKKATEAGIEFKDVGEGISDSLQEGLFLNDLAGWEDQISLYGNFDDGELERNKEKVKQFVEDIETATNGVTQALASDIKIGNTENIEFDTEMLETYGKLMEQAKIDTDELATSYAAAMMGSSDFNAALGENSKNAQAMTQHFINYKNAIGASAQETVTGAALIQSGFRTIAEAVNAGAMDVVNEQANELAHSLLDLPDDKRIEISAEGDISVIDEATDKIEQIQDENVTVKINADGNIEILNTATGEMQTLSNLGNVHIGINAEGDIAILDQANQEIATINKNGEITVNGEYPGADEIQQALDDKNKVEDKNANLKVDGQYYGKEDIAQAISDGNALQSKSVTYTVNYVHNGTPPKQQATGTDNFPGGLAMVNDQTGVADPRELIVDHGQAFIPQGRNVILPLSKGAKVYTASQTKAIMAGIGLPRYAGGKDNSDAFTSARDDWSHYTRTHAVTILEEYEKWLEFQEKFKDNEKDIQDIEEQLFAYRQKMYSERVSASESWLDHEERYNGLAASDYIAGLDRMKQYMAEYYAEGVISREEYNEQILRLDEKRIDKEREMLKKQQDESLAWIRDRTYFNDWQNYGDTPEAAYGRVKERLDTALAEGKILWDDYNDYLTEAGSAFYQGRREQSESWLEEQRKYFGMSAEDYVAGLEREKAYTEEYYRLGLISAREYHEGITEINHQIWDEAASAYDDMLSKQSEYISDMREKFADEEQALRDSWDVADRDEDMDDVRRQLEIYAGAVTDRGQQKYKDLQEQLKQLERDEELYQLQVDNNAVLERLEADYDKAEDAKADFLKSIAVNTDIDVSGIVGGLTERLTTTGGNIENLLAQLIEAVNNSSAPSSTVYGPTYNDNRQISLTQTSGLVPLYVGEMR